MVIGLWPDKVDEYKRLHAAVWPEVIEALRRNGWRNFTIFLKEPENLLFGSFEFVGEDFEESSRRIAADQETQRWLALTDACQRPFETRQPGEWWARMQPVFHMD